MDDAQAAKLRELAERAQEHGYSRSYWMLRLAADASPDVLLALLDERDEWKERHGDMVREFRALKAQNSTIYSQQRQALIDELVAERDAAMALLREARGVIALMRDWHDPQSATAKAALARIDALLGNKETE